MPNKVRIVEVLARCGVAGSISVIYNILVKAELTVIVPVTVDVVHLQRYIGCRAAQVVTERPPDL